MTLIPQSIVEGKVVNITKFGAFVDVNGEIGLVHISEVSQNYVKDINDYLKENDVVRVKVLGVDDKGKASFSIKQADFKIENKYNKYSRTNDFNRKDKVSNFEDKLSKYLKDSEERMSDIKKNRDYKYRSGKRNFG